MNLKPYLGLPDIVWSREFKMVEETTFKEIYYLTISDVSGYVITVCQFFLKYKYITAVETRFCKKIGVHTANVNSLIEGYVKT